MTQDDPKPVHTRTPSGRHKVDLRQLPGWVKYPIALGVVGFVLWLVVSSDEEPAVEPAAIEPYGPYIGVAVIIVIAVALWLKRKG